MYLRAFLLSRYGQDIDRSLDDSTGQLTALINHCALPSATAQQPVLDVHEVLRGFVPQLLAEAEAECKDLAAERARAAATTVIEAVSNAAASTTLVIGHDEVERPAIALTGRPSCVPDVQPVAPVDELFVVRQRHLLDADTVIIARPVLDEPAVLTVPDPKIEQMVSMLRELDARTA